MSEPYEREGRTIIPDPYVSQFGTESAGPTRAELELIAEQIRDFPLFGARAVLVIVDGPEGIVAACTERDQDEIRGLMFRAGIALPGGVL